MGNEQSQEAPPETQSASDQDDFDLSAIPDTRRNHSSPQPASASPPPTTMARKRKAGKTRANSKKKRKQSRDEPDEESTEEPQPEVADQPNDEETRLAEEIMLREQARRVREREPEMFDEYAMSDGSDHDVEAATQAPEVGEAVPAKDDDQGEGLLDTRTGPHAGENSDQEAAEVQGGSEVDDEEAGEEGHTSLVDARPKPATDGSNDSVDSDPDEQPEPAVVEDTPVPKHGKRKRPDNESPESSNRSKSSKKRKRAGLPTPPATGDHDAVDEALPDVTTAGQSKKPARRQSSMEDYTQPFTKGSDLRHPVYNPESPEAHPVRQEVEVIVPMSTAGQSDDHKKTLGASISDAPGPSSLQPRNLGLKRRPKGPLSSPVRKGDTEAREDPWDVRAQAEASHPNGTATSTAKRTLGGDDNESGSDYEHPNGEWPEQSPESKEKRRKEKGKGRVQASKSRSTTPTARGPYTHRCPICSSTFPSEKSLEKHRADPTAHDNLIDCDKCDKQFATKAGLARHQKEKGHGAGNGLQGDTGRFTTEEIDKIDRWGKRFRREHDLNKYEFNEIMTASGKSGNETWPYKFITRTEFVQEYYDVLPRRNTRSMRRYRAKFQNVDRSREFTAQDDADIITLVEQLGQKWTEIGEQLLRDPEIVRQRWKNKLMIQKHGKTVGTGTWNDAEAKRFKDAVKEIRRMTISAGIEDVDTFNWTAVSLKVKTRSAQQCANHWRAMHGTNVNGQWVDSGAAQIMKPKSPSKMKQRLAGKQLSKSKIEDSDEEAGPNNNISEREDEDTNNSDSEAPKAEEVGQAPHSDSGADTEDEAKLPVAETPLKRSKPLLSQTKTPGNGISASQAFEQTQANTSALKKSTKQAKRSTPSQEQPTPGIAVQARPERSPEFGKKLDEVLQDQDSDADESDVEAEEAAQDDEAASADEEDNSSDSGEAVEAEEASQDDEEQSSVEEEEEEEEVSAINDEAEQGSEEETRSASEEASDAGSEISEASGVAKEASKPMSDDEQPEVDRISQIFKNAASHKKRYGQRRQEKPQKGKNYQWPEESQSQSDSSSDDEQVGVGELPR